MERIKIITTLLILSLVLNIFLVKNYFDEQSEKVELEKVIIMNEFSQRAKEWRNLTQFVTNLSASNDIDFPISEEESDLYWELATPMKSVIMKTTDKVNPIHPLYNEYVAFLIEFDLKYEAIINRFKSKLPLMSKAQLINFSNQLEEGYSLFIGDAMGHHWSIRTDKLDINFEPQKYKLDQVIEKLTLIREELEALETTSEKHISDKRFYEIVDGKAADILSYNYEDRSMYIAGLKVFEEFGTKNEGGVSISSDGHVLTFSMIKATGSVTGAVDGPHVYFQINLITNEIIDKKFEPAPNYSELGILEFAEYSNAVIKLNDEQIFQIGLYFKDLITGIEEN
ncbi:MAG: hypothetical protein JJT76_06630 [Clostridiaceae bacterium]|nr:hypothetical protein [Clostridiaceae bacterium]